MDEPRTRAAAGVADGGSHEDAAIGLDRQRVRPCRRPRETLTVTRPSFPKVVSRVPLLFRRNRAIPPDALPATTILPSGAMATTATTLPKFGNGISASPCWPKLASGCPEASVRQTVTGVPALTATIFPSGWSAMTCGAAELAVPPIGRIATPSRAERRVEVARADLARVVERERRGGEDAERGTAAGVAQGQVDRLVPLEVAARVDQGDRELAARHAGAERDRAGERGVLAAGERRAIRGREVDRDGPLAPPEPDQRDRRRGGILVDRVVRRRELDRRRGRPCRRDRLRPWLCRRPVRCISGRRLLRDRSTPWRAPATRRSRSQPSP